MSSSTLTLPQREQHRRPSTAAADATSPTAPRSPWARTRHDLVIWLVLSDLFAVAVPFWLALLGGHLPLVWSATTVGITMVLIAWFLGALGIDAVEQAGPGTGRFVAAAAVSVPVALLLADLSGVARTTLLATLAAQLLLAVTGRSIEAGWLRRRRLEGHALRRTLIVMGSGSQPMLTQLRRHPMDGFLIVGYLSSGQDRAFHSAEPVRSPQHIAQTLHAERIDAVMTVGSVIPEDLVTLMRGLEGTQVRLVVAPGLQDVVPGRMRALTVTHGWTGLIAVKTRRTRAAGKALFDRLAGAIGLTLISPLLAATALAIRLDSPVRSSTPRPVWARTASPSPCGSSAPCTSTPTRAAPRWSRPAATPATRSCSRTVRTRASPAWAAGSAACRLTSSPSSSTSCAGT